MSEPAEGDFDLSSLNDEELTEQVHEVVRRDGPGQVADVDVLRHNRNRTFPAPAP